MANPLMNRALNEGVKDRQTPSADHLNSMYMAPSAENRNAGPGQPVQPQAPAAERPMQYNDVFMKSLACFGVLLVGAIVGWVMPALALPAVLIGLVLGLINAFKREPVPFLILTYAAVEGVFLGGISKIFETAYDGIVIQAVLATLSVFAVMFALFKFKIVRFGAKGMKFLMLAVGGYAVFSLVNFFYVMFTGNGGARNVQIELFGMTFPLGIIIGVVAVVLASLTLITDFQAIEAGVDNKIPERYSWTMAFSLMVSLIWLYVEILRLLSYFRQD